MTTALAPPETAHAGSIASSTSAHDIDRSRVNQRATVKSPAETPEEVGVTDMVYELSTALESAIGEIHSVNSETKVLALNARIEAARAGTHGAAFGVVAEEMQLLSDKTFTIANDMANRTREKTSELMGLIDSTVRGTRLSDLALVNIDLIDRNLYERTCDVRWWATDGSLVDALSPSTTDDDALAFASRRLGVILDAYTVYHDLVLCDREGSVVANGRPDQFQSVGSHERTSFWFGQAFNSSTGDEYGFQTAHESKLVGNQPSLVYSCGVREGGDSSGKLLGVLGIVFDWLGLAQPILNNMPIPQREKSSTQAFIVDRSGAVLASNQGFPIGKKLDLPDFNRILASKKGFYVTDFENQSVCVGHALAPGFETYSTDWVSIVLQPIGL